MNLLSKVCDLFETYRGHDSVIGLIGYKCGMISGLMAPDSPLGSNLKSISSQISNARIILRFLDDYPMLAYTLSYGLGRSVLKYYEKIFIVRVLNIIGNLSSHVYYIAEHFAYFADNKIINANSGIFWLISILAWLISLITQIFCNLIALLNLIKNNKEDDEKQTKSRKYFKKVFIRLYFKLFEDLFWLVNCIHWLPPGFLWSSKLSDFWSGLFGVSATVCGLASKL